MSKSVQYNMFHNIFKHITYLKNIITFYTTSNINSDL